MKVIEYLKKASRGFEKKVKAEQLRIESEEMGKFSLLLARAGVEGGADVRAYCLSEVQKLRKRKTEIEEEMKEIAVWMEDLTDWVKKQ